MNSPTFNQRMQKARIGASLPHDQSYARFARTHPSNRPFLESAHVDITATDAIVGVLAVVGLVSLLALLRGWL